MSGLLFFNEAQLTSEMAARTVPSLLDLLVALASGFAAAYATSRPNLSAALPGVAIAAALVPPIATAGLALSLIKLQAVGGALLLFLTNIVAITVGAAISLWLVGIRGSHMHSRFQQWTVLGLAAVFIAMLSLVVLYALP